MSEQSDGNDRPLKAKLAELYYGASDGAHAFRYTLLVFDVATILFLITSSFLLWTQTTYADAFIGVVILADFAARMWIARDKKRFFLNPTGIADIIVVISLLAPILGEGFAFLRILRIVRLLRSYQLLKRLRQDFVWFRNHQQTTTATLNLFVFLFIMTAFIYETQHYTNPKITNYVDALYFTVTTLTTTGFGDIVLEGTSGRLLSVAIMIVGVSFFLRLVQLLLRPEKVEHKCPTCGLKRHDHDAVHCKACGTVLSIEDEGAV